MSEHFLYIVGKVTLKMRSKENEKQPHVYTGEEHSRKMGDCKGPQESFRLAFQGIARIKKRIFFFLNILNIKSGVNKEGGGVGDEVTR